VRLPSRLRGRPPPPTVRRAILCVARCRFASSSGRGVALAMLAPESSRNGRVGHGVPVRGTAQGSVTLEAAMVARLPVPAETSYADGLTFQILNA